MIAEVKGSVTIACNAGYGSGGMGRHLEEITEYLKLRGIAVTVIANEGFDPIWLRLLKKLPPLRFSAGWQGYLEGVVFDYHVAKRLTRGDVFIGFNGQALRSFRRARTLFRELVLVAATPHINFTTAQLQKAWEYFPAEPTGYVRPLHEQYLLEYEMADRIIVGSELTRETFLRETIPAHKLERFHYSAHPRFKPGRRPGDGRFRVVSVGSLNLIKGVAVLIDAFKNFEESNAELTLVGGSGTRQIRRYLAAAMAGDSRIKIAPGDPLPHLQAADVCVHASFQDGFAYAPMEALACGVPVIVTDQTGMKEHVRYGENGFVVRTSDANAITVKLREIQKSGLRAPI